MTWKSKTASHLSALSQTFYQHFIVACMVVDTLDFLAGIASVCRNNLEKVEENSYLMSSHLGW